MKKTYPPYQLTYSAPLGTEVKFEVKLISDGNFGSTFVNLPGSIRDKLISNNGTYSLGNIENLVSELTIVASNFINPLDVEDTIKIKYLFNDKEIVHENLKSEADDVVILIKVNFVVS